MTATDSSGLIHTTSVNLPVFSDTTPPSNPSGLVATATGSSQINLTWTASTDNSGSTDYQVERCQGVGCSSFVLIATVSTTSYTNTGLTANTPNSYRIRAVDGALNRSNYTSISATTGGGGGLQPGDGRWG